MTTPLRIGFAGAGGIVRTRHLPNLRNIDGVEFVSVCNSTQDSSERFAQEFGLQKVYSDWRELVHDDGIDIVWIGTWPYLHCPITLEALNAGKHVFCQARMAMNVDEARRMLDASRQSDRVTMLCPPPMGLKGDHIMRKIRDYEMLGDIHTIHFRDLTSTCIDPESPIHWRQRQELSGVNALTVGIYAEVVHRWFGYAKSVSAEAKTFTQERPSFEGCPVPVTRPDAVFALSEMENGALMRWEWSAMADCEPISVLEAFGSSGSICYDFLEDEIIFTDDGENWNVIDITPDEERQWTVERDFIAAIREGKEVHPNFEDGVKYMEFTEAVFRSVEKGERVHLPLT